MTEKRDPEKSYRCVRCGKVFRGREATYGPLRRMFCPNCGASWLDIEEWRAEDGKGSVDA